MKLVLVALACALLTQIVYGRDSGFALECASIENGQTQIISFLEEDIDKRVRYIETDSRSMWDSHEWQIDKFHIISYMQLKGEEAASIVSTIEIDRETLEAEFVPTSTPNEITKMQCERWAPRIRNK